MMAITPLQRNFVWAKMNGARSNLEAAHMAGYKGDKNTLAVTGHRCAHDEKVQAAMLEEARKRMNETGILAVNQLAGLLTSNDEKTRLRAIEMTLNRIGLHALTEHKVDVNHSISDADSIKEIFTLAKALKLDPKLLLGQAGIEVPKEVEVIDAEFDEIEAEVDQQIASMQPDTKEEWE